MLSVIGVERSGSTRLAQILDTLRFRVYDEIFHPITPWGLRRDDLLLKKLQNIEFPRKIKEEHFEWTQLKEMNQKFTIEAMNSFNSNPLRLDNIPLKLVQELSRTYKKVSITIFLSHLDSKTIAQLLSISRFTLITSRSPIDSFISLEKAIATGSFVAKGTDTTAMLIDLDPNKLLSYTNAQAKLYYKLGEQLGLLHEHAPFYFLKYEDWSNLENSAQEVYIAAFLAAVMRGSPVDTEDLKWESGLDMMNSKTPFLRQDRSSSWLDKVSNSERIAEKLETPRFKHCLSKYLCHEEFLKGYQSSRHAVIK